ncbi:MAG: hypothetical protein ACRDZ3_01260 [Acidimicrobiia bacterium]
MRELERHGMPVARLAMGHRQVDAFSVRFVRRPIVLLVDDKSNYVRSRFDASMNSHTSCIWMLSRAVV